MAQQHQMKNPCEKSELDENNFSSPAGNTEPNRPRKISRKMRNDVKALFFFHFYDVDIGSDAWTEPVTVI